MTVFTLKNTLHTSAVESTQSKQVHPTSFQLFSLFPNFDTNKRPNYETMFLDFVRHACLCSLLTSGMMWSDMDQI